MGKKWDSNKGGRDQWIEWLTTVMKECLRVIKPGGMILVWSIPRTSHWTATAIENAGFEIREKIYHLFGSGFPKSTNISKQLDKKLGAKREVVGIAKGTGKQNPAWNGTLAGRKENSLKPEYDLTAPATPEAQKWEGYGTATKPAVEEWILAMKLIDGTFAENALKWGVAGLWIDGGRVEATNRRSPCGADGKVHRTTGNCYGEHKQSEFDLAKGRWPANLIVQHHSDCMKIGVKKVKSVKQIKSKINPYESDRTWSVSKTKDNGKNRWFGDEDGNETIEEYQCHPKCPIFQLNQQAGVKKSGTNCTRTKEGFFLEHGGMGKAGDKQITYGDEGYVSRYFLNLPPDTNRFFYSAKASRSERNQGCEGVITWESVDLNQDLTELKELLKGISEDGVQKIKEYEWNTISYGKKTTDQYQKDMMFIISMTSKMIIELKTLSCSQHSITKDSILDAIKMSEEIGLSLVKSVEYINILKQNIIDVQMVSVLGAVVVALKMLLKIREKRKQGNTHSTVKPLSLIKYFVSLLKQPQNTLMLDLFAGSGTLGVACEQLKIPYILIEKEPEYCDIIRARVKAANQPDKPTKRKPIVKPTNTLYDWNEINSETT